MKKILFILSLFNLLFFTASNSMAWILVNDHNVNGNASFENIQIVAEEKRLIDINTASVKELIALKGIGEKIAKEIIEYREKNGPFKKIEDIMKVKGIGKDRFEKIKERINISGTE